MEVAIFPSNLHLRASFNVSMFYAAVAIFTYSVFSKKCLCASVPGRKVQLLLYFILHCSQPMCHFINE